MGKRQDQKSLNFRNTGLWNYNQHVKFKGKAIGGMYMIVLIGIVVLLFIYLGYVLINPDKF